MVETAIGFVLGAVVGSIATAAGSYLLYWKRDRDATRRLRRALIEELRSYEYVDEMADAGEYERLTERVEPPIVYEAVGGDLGRLDEGEIAPLVGFYADVYWLQDLEDPEDKKRRIESVADRRRAAIESLGG